MATCKDCIHYDVCYYRINSESANAEGRIINCSDFKDKSNYTEVVRCKNCDYCGFCGAATNLDVMGFYGFCSRGKSIKKQKSTKGDEA